MKWKRSIRCLHINKELKNAINYEDSNDNTIIYPLGKNFVLSGLEKKGFFKKLPNPAKSVFLVTVFFK